jgi:hypothetical protein
MSTFDDVKKFTQENSVTISIVVLLIAVIYINIKVNDLNYRLQQTIMYQPMRQTERSYNYEQPCRSSGWF